MMDAEKAKDTVLTVHRILSTTVDSAMTPSAHPAQRQQPDSGPPSLTSAALLADRSIARENVRSAFQAGEHRRGRGEFWQAWYT